MTKRAVCIGINDYPGSGADLSGCVNDAQDMAQMLRGRQYTPVDLLLDGDATKGRILETLERNVGSLKYRDTLVVHYSGHGSWIPDVGGDEPDGRDEVLVAHDYNYDGLISDDELYEVFDQRAYGTRIFFFSDSCHSGSVNRFAPLDATGGLVRRFLPPEIFLRSSELDAAFEVEHLKAKTTTRTGAVLMSGCSDWEYSYDAWFGSRPNGAFTRTLLDRLVSYAPANIKDLHTAVRVILPNADYPQSPQLNATWHQRKWMI